MKAPPRTPTRQSTVKRNQGPKSTLRTISKPNTKRRLFPQGNATEVQKSKQNLFEWLNEIQSENIQRFEKKYGFSIVEEKPVAFLHKRFVWTPLQSKLIPQERN